MPGKKASAVYCRQTDGEKERGEREGGRKRKSDFLNLTDLKPLLCKAFSHQHSPGWPPSFLPDRQRQASAHALVCELTFMVFNLLTR